MYHQAAVEATAKAEGADMAAAQAGKDATKYSGMLTIEKVNGDSTKAMMNAQMVLDAQDAVDMALMDAEAAKMQAMNAKTAAEAIPEGTAGKSQAIAALDAALMVANEAIKAVTAIRDGRALDDAVFEVIGTDGAGTPRSIADTVGKFFDTALKPTSATNNQGAGVSPGDAATTTTGLPLDSQVMMDDSQGMTWAQIAGEANVMMVRAGTVSADGTYAAGNQPLSLASIAGMTAKTADVTDTNADVVVPTGSVLASGTDGAGFSTSTYMGISGAVICLGGTDGCSITDGKLSDGWYFSPSLPKAYYVRNPDRTASEATPYVMDNLYAQYGYWLSTADSGVTYTVNTYSLRSGGTTGTDFNVGADTDLAGSATYSGNAVGMSVRRTPKAGGGNHFDSGMFTADVTLQATFGASPMLGGDVNNFQGDAVNSNWSVTLEKRAFTAGAIADTDGKSLASGQDGYWSASAYGNDTAARPAGIFGEFNAHFLDGDVAGAYATRKE